MLCSCTHAAAERVEVLTDAVYYTLHRQGVFSGSGVRNVGDKCKFAAISPSCHTPKSVQYSAKVTSECKYEVICGLSSDINFNVPLTRGPLATAEPLAFITDVFFTG